MATIAENIQTLRSIKSDIKNAITGKGGSVGNDFKTYAQAITNLPSGGGGNEDLINLIEGDVTTLNIPDGTTKIGEYAFYSRKLLTEITIPNSVTSIGSFAFQNCSALTEITIPDGVTGIGDSAFSGCSNLTEITIPDGVTSISYSAFSYCSALTKITIPNSVTSIGSFAFQNCSALTEITIPDGVTSIGNYAFQYCSGLTEITIPDGVTSIGSFAFQNCSSLTSITIMAATPPTLRTGVFDNTNNCPIYVPAASVDAYKTATNWSKYADRIYAIGTVIEGSVIEGGPSGPIIN